MNINCPLLPYQHQIKLKIFSKLKFQEFYQQLLQIYQQQNAVQILIQQYIYNKMSEDRYVFLVQWYDNTACLVRQYNFTYFLKDGAIEMYDIKNRRIFLKRCDYPGITLKDLFIGSTISVYSRQLKVVDYTDDFTKSSLEKQKGKTFFLIKPDGYMEIGKIINILEQEEFSIGNLKMAKMSSQEANNFCSNLKGRLNSQTLSSDLVVGIQIIADDSINKAQKIAASICKKFGKSGRQDVVYTSESSNQAIKDREFFFANNSSLKCPALFTSCTCVVIKPHIVVEGYVGQILDQILLNGFQISAIQMFWLDRPAAQQFLEIYKNVFPEFSQIVDQISNGSCIALEARQNNAVPAMRQLCGPHDPQMAKTTRPKSIRSTYGKDKVRNAVHCTDLMEDGLLQVEYFFNILQK